MLHAAFRLLRLLQLPALLLLLLHLLQHECGHALGMSLALSVAVYVYTASKREAALLAQEEDLLVRVLDLIKVLMRGLPQAPHALVGDGRQQSPQLLRRGGREGADPRPAEVCRLEEQPRGAIEAFHAHRDELASGAVAHHLAVREAAYAKAHLVADVESCEGGALVEAAHVTECRQQVPVTAEKVIGPGAPGSPGAAGWRPVLHRGRLLLCLRARGVGVRGTEHVRQRPARRVGLALAGCAKVADRHM
mmetsp:Transcript_7667/g.22480  ORF Transcript_7667/g.22480 Transcript_7667/m.22480 type:complete len:249 (+) Transcript_7667:930-1676(+)